MTFINLKRIIIFISMADFLRDFLIGGVSAAVSKTAAAPFERVILLTATNTRFNYIR